MKRKIFTITVHLFVLSFIIQNVHAQWEQTNGPYSATADGVMSAGSFLVVRLDDHLGYKITNGGQTFTILGNGLPINKENNGFAYIAPNYFVTCSGTGIFKSTDNGNNWFSVNNGLPLFANKLLASGNYLFCSVYYPDGLFVSTNQGNNWQYAGNGLPFQINILDIFQIGNTIYLCSSRSFNDSGGVYRTTNIGSLWTRAIHNGLPNKYINGITNKSGNLYVSMHGVYKSSNGGDDWQNISNNLPDTTTGNIENDGTNMYIETGLGLFKTTNDGISWFSIDNELNNKAIFGIKCFHTDIFVATRWYGVYKSTNGGNNWLQFNNGILNSYCDKLISIENSLITNTNSDNGLFKSTDNGNTWNTANGGFYQLPFIISLFTYGQDVYAAVSFNLQLNSQVWKSINKGNSWSNSSTGLPNAKIYDFASNSNAIFCATDSGIFKSTNNGNSWIITGLTSKTKLITSSTTNIIAVVNDSDIFVSSNSGTNWNKITNGLPQTNYRYYTALEAFDNNSYLYFYNSGNSGMYFSNNNGLNWQYRNNGIASAIYMNAFVNYNNNIFTTGSRYIYRTNNDGLNWINVTSNLSNYYSLSSLTILGPYMFVGTEGDGIWRRPISQIIGIKNILSELPSSFSLKQNYPNPFNPMTKIQFDVSKYENVRISIYDVSGKELQVIVNERLQPGTYEVEWYGAKYASGVYFYKMETENYVETRKMILIR